MGTHLWWPPLATILPGSPALCWSYRVRAPSLGRGQVLTTTTSPLKSEKIYCFAVTVYYFHRADLDEESGWMTDQLHVIEALQEPQSLPAAQSMLAKHEAFKTDLNVHEQTLADVKDAGEKLIDEVGLVYSSHYGNGSGVINCDLLLFFFVFFVSVIQISYTFSFYLNLIKDFYYFV